MSDTVRLEVRPEVTTFLEQVRARLADLTEEERDELLGGLEADLAELVEDGGSLAELGDPRAYADELRLAAGLERTRGGAATGVARRPRRPVRVIVAGLLDGARDRFDRWVAAGPSRVQAWEVLRALRPAWWVLRAWVAVQLLDLYTGPWEYPTLLPRFGDDVSGKLLLAGAVVASVLLGLRRSWPASQAARSVLARSVLLGLNGFAVLMLLVVANSFPSSLVLHDTVYGGRGADVVSPGLLNDGELVRNVFAYDAEGNPLEGVQLFDQRGAALAVDPDVVHRMRYGTRLPTVYPWRAGEARVWNVYPLPVAYNGGGWDRSDRVWTRDEPPFVPQSPPVAVPRVTLPLPQGERPAGRGR